VRGYCAAVRAALTDDGLPPLAASGLKLQDRLSQIAASLDRVAAQAGSLPGGLKRLQQLLRRGLEEAAALFPPVREAYKWVKRAARVLEILADAQALAPGPDGRLLPARRRTIRSTTVAWLSSSAATVRGTGSTIPPSCGPGCSAWPSRFARRGRRSGSRSRSIQSRVNAGLAACGATAGRRICRLQRPARWFAFYVWQV
jgi:hypothetical protein